MCILNKNEGNSINKAKYKFLRVLFASFFPFQSAWKCIDLNWHELAVRKLFHWNVTKTTKFTSLLDLWLKSKYGMSTLFSFSNYIFQISQPLPT